MSSKKRDLNAILMVFLIAVVGLALTPSIYLGVVNFTQIDQIDRPGQSASQNASGIIWPGNLTRGPARTIIILMPMFWVILVVAIPVTSIAWYLKTT